MKTCIKCGSHAFNLHAEEIDQGGLCDVHYWQGRAHRAEALEQPEQEPVFLIYDDAGGWIESNESEYRKTEEVNRWLLYTTPPKEQQSCDKRPWVSLTDAEMFELSEFRNAHGYVPTSAKRLFARIEAKLKALNT